MPQEQTYERRAFGRLIFPPTDRPQLKVVVDLFETHDISEEGIRFLCHEKKFSIGQKVTGVLTFHDGTTHQIEGEVIRVMTDQVVLRLFKGFMKDLALHEQRFIINRQH